MPLIKLKQEKSTDWKWWFKDYPDKNGISVFSCFACAGGSTMGYKLAGCDVIGCLEIDKRMNDVYVKNHSPKYNFLMDIREFNKMDNDDLPQELFNLDILDGSPPCTTFSMAGKREETWGKKKKFAEGQTEQILDELIFEFANTAKKLMPKVVIMENVKGLVLGNAIEYYNKYLKIMKSNGYQSRGYILKGETMGVPQKRHIVFVVSVRNDVTFDFSKLDLHFNYCPVLFGEIKSGVTKDISHTKTFERLSLMENKPNFIGDIMINGNRVNSGFNCTIMWDDDVASTLVSSTSNYRASEKSYCTGDDYRNMQTFPQDFDFLGANPQYICGMSVPPIMTKRLVTRLIETGVFTE